MNEQKNNGRGIFYGVIGVATLVVAIIGATFAYFTATAANNVMTGNMATVSLGLDVVKTTTADVTKGGMIPMSNSMVEAAVSNASKEGICVDDNGNAVCQIYKITVTNSSSAGQYVDGYVALRGGSGVPTDIGIIGDEDGDGACDVDGDDKRTQGAETDFTESNCKAAIATYVDGAKFDNAGAVASTGIGTTMRWAQVFISGDTDKDGVCEDGENECKYSTAGTQNLLSVNGSESVGLTINSIDAATATDPLGFNRTNMLVDYDSVKGTQKILGNDYDVVAKNYVRISNHTWNIGGKESYDRHTDITSALVFNHNIAGNAGVEGNTVSTTYHFVVWLTETGTNQTAGTTVGADADAITNPGAASFFSGNVTFTSAQGSEVSATFSGYAKVKSDQA